MKSQSSEDFASFISLSLNNEASLWVNPEGNKVLNIQPLMWVFSANVLLLGFYTCSSAANSGNNTETVTVFSFYFIL